MADNSKQVHLNNEQNQRFNLITRSLHEVLGADIVKQKISTGEQLKCYWGTAPTGRPHVGYFVPLVKIADFLRAGVEVKVLMADIHAFLDNLKAPFELVQDRVKYYTKLLRSIFISLDVPVDNLIFVVGSSYQLTPQYSMDSYRLAAMTTEHDAKKAGAEVVKQVSSPLLSGMLYPGLQALDEEHLGCDFQFGGVDQRKIFVMAESLLPKLGYAKRAHLMNAMVPGLAGGKMSSSDPNSKIDFLDSAADVKKKIKLAFCEEGNVQENGLLAFLKAVVLPIAAYKQLIKGASPFAAQDAANDFLFSVTRPERFGGSLHYKDYDKIEHDFSTKALHPGDLKKAVEDAINTLLDPIRKDFEADEEFKAVEKAAYPPPIDPAAAAKEAKKAKNEAKKNKTKASAATFQQQSVDSVADQVERVEIPKQ
ncbi:hypothetical protein E3P92_02809 [Wallemia ichthyophaga]|uniref:Tyrosine--tRNA ligase n=2 Tax=Wallemia ichthyophaga TaxID=245174 RepID=A0A4T0JP09_WALIC|nr:Tyrosine--tRNA ligase, cytoplasmic [Wallemia ichthyophaga EXF-994]TIA70357.1 hypothetical protein E3P91_03116 [Wallemia ichthyophaga]EOQ99247.1 Tyrosine--tRNA ligase, cytoplasmic [Wallemia ichthyophaga EXF-994]TIA80686.1 hypothetical protein E3P98_02552 [Wallemia ichthyophaga]TIA89279.1 hypothetical protein E3P97_03129 [Wallemia ichthyophaga]TIA95185.1 hypothetical protein E3P96_03893 [Wallemia ichthyophaga]